MKELLEEFWQAISMYWGNWRILVLFAVIVLILLFRKKTGEYRKGLLMLLAVLLVLVYNPPAKYFWAKVMQGHLYWRMFWILPAVPIMAFVMTELIRKKAAWKNLLLGILVVAAIIVCGKNVYTNGNFTKAENKFKLPQEAVMIADYMLTEDGETKALVPEEIFCHIRQYSSKIALLYGRDILGFTSPVRNKRYHKVYEEMESERPNVQTIMRAAKKYECQYVVFDSAKILRGNPENYGYELKTQIGRFLIYRKEGAAEHE